MYVQGRYYSADLQMPGTPHTAYVFNSLLRGKVCHYIFLMANFLQIFQNSHQKLWARGFSSSQLWEGKRKCASKLFISVVVII